MSERDPRVSPQRGDVLRKGNGPEITVLWVRGLLGTVRWQTADMPVRFQTCSGVEWRKWAANATVVRRGEG